MGLLVNTEGSKTFKVIECEYEPVIQYIPTERYQRGKLYDSYKEMGITLPNYSKFSERRDIKRVDMLVLRKEFKIIFYYKSKVFVLYAFPGCCFDGTSVPSILAHGRVSRVSPFSLKASLVHDILYAMKYFSKQAADDIFEGLLREESLPIVPLYEHMLALFLCGGFVYNKKEKSPTWHTGFNSLYCCGKPVETNARIS